MIEFRVYDDRDDDGHYHGYQQDVYEDLQGNRYITHRAIWNHGAIVGYQEWHSRLSETGNSSIYQII